jgi:6-phosphogluconolactonase (cycloisomerase 2 family)
VASAAEAPPGALSALPGPTGCIGGRNELAIEFGFGRPERCARIRGETFKDFSFADFLTSTLATVSPDGRFLYTASRGADIVRRGPDAIDSGIEVFARNRRGALRQLRGAAGCTTAIGRQGCRRARTLQGVAALAISPDGRHLYAAASHTSTIMIFRRSRRTGILRRITGSDGCVHPRRRGRACRSGRALGGVYTLLVSPDGRNLYAGTEAVTSFERDPRTGSLRQLPGARGCVTFGPPPTSSACPTIHPEVRQSAFVLQSSADGAWMTVASPYALDDPVIFRRDAQDGSLEPIAPLCEPACEPESAAGALWLSPDGQDAYVADRSGEVALWTRHPVTGQLNARQVVYRLPCGSRDGCDRLSASLVVSRSGRTAYVSFEDYGVLAFSRDPATGRLSRLPGRHGCRAIRPRRPNCGSAPGLVQPIDIILPADERNLYAVSDQFSVTALAREPG